MKDLVKELGSGIIKADVTRLASRTIIDKETGTVTLFAFDEGQKLSEHTAAFDALVYVLDGETEVAISKKSDCLKEGDMIMMPANQPHAVQSSHQVQNVPSHDKIVVADVL